MSQLLPISSFPSVPYSAEPTISQFHPLSTNLVLCIYKILSIQQRVDSAHFQILRIHHNFHFSVSLHLRKPGYLYLANYKFDQILTFSLFADISHSLHLQFLQMEFYSLLVAAYPTLNIQVSPFPKTSIFSLLSSAYLHKCVYYK